MENFIKEKKSKENSLAKNFNPISILLIILIAFVLFIAYKYISSGIQENKEKAVIQERAKVQQSTPQTKMEKKAKFPDNLHDETWYGCNVGSELESLRSWIQACYLRGLLTSECKEVFDTKGYYLTDNESVDLWTYSDNAKLCECKLPSSIADEINNTEASSKRRCDLLKKSYEK